MPDQTTSDQIMSHNNKQIQYGDWVIWNDRVMYVYDMKEDEPEVFGLIHKDSKKLLDRFGMPYYEAEYHPASEIYVLPKTDVDENTLRSFFRLEVTCWDLCEKELYPMTDQGTFTLTEEDLKVLSRNVRYIDTVTLDEWANQFFRFDHVECPEEKEEGLSLKLTWIILRQIMGWFDIEEDDPEYYTELIDLYFANKGKPINEIDTSDRVKKWIIEGIESQKRDAVTDDEREGYIRFLDDLYEHGDPDYTKRRAIAYFGGSRIVKSDWKKSEESFLKLIDMGRPSAPGTLGYIYYKGVGGIPDYEKAYEYFSIAADNNIPEAKCYISDMYRKGQWVEKDPDEAFSILEPIYEEQLQLYENRRVGCAYAEAALRMGYCYEDGSGCQQDLLKAKQYYVEAKEAIEKRIKYDMHPNDEYIAIDIDRSLLRIAEKLEKEYGVNPPEISSEIH